MSAAGAPSRGRRARSFLRGLVRKVMEDDVFFMAGAVAFSLLIALIPLVILGVGLTGYLLSALVDDPVAGTVSVVQGLVPQRGGTLDVGEAVAGVVEGVLAQRTGFTLFGAIFFVLLATRLVGTLRVALRHAFQVERERGILHGKLFDVWVVVLGVVLLTLNLGVTVTFGAALRFGVDLLSLGGSVLGGLEWVGGHLLALVSVWTLFAVVYRYLPARRTPWRTALVAATFSAVGHEVLKVGFGWYATEVADYTSTWGNLATVAVFFFWIYYEAVVFILGAEVAQVSSTERAGMVEAEGAREGVS